MWDDVDPSARRSASAAEKSRACEFVARTDRAAAALTRTKLLLALRASRAAARNIKCWGDGDYLDVRRNQLSRHPLATRNVLFRDTHVENIPGSAYGTNAKAKT